MSNLLTTILRNRRLAMAFAACILCVACRTPQPVPEGPPPDAADLLREYNKRAEGIRRIWARVEVEAHWVDEDGSSQSERGDGQLFVRKPRELALTIGKLGDIYFWLGCNERAFWWFDENPHDKLPNTAYIGLNENIGKPGMPRLPTPVPPDQLIELLGITELPPESIEAAKVTMPKGGGAAIWFDIPNRLSNNTVKQRVLVGAITGRPLAIQFADQQGRIIAEARLSEYQLMKVPDAPYGAWPYVATRIDINIPEPKSSLTLHMEGLRSDKSKFKDALFDFAALQAARKPEQIRDLAPKP